MAQALTYVGGDKWGRQDMIGDIIGADRICGINMGKTVWEDSEALRRINWNKCKD
jgi:hypothetical protein